VFCVDAKILGTNQHLLISDDLTKSWVQTIPTDVWHLSGEQKTTSDWCLDTALVLDGKVIDLEPSKPFVDAMALLLPSGSVPWQKVMPSSAHQTFTDALVSRVVDAIASLNSRYYKSTWVPQNRLFRQFQRPRINAERWRELVLANPNNRMLKSFAPDSSGLAGPVTYGRTTTRTGRLTVIAGPQVLTLNKAFRDIVAPLKDDHEIGAFDYNACEMRVLLYEAGFNCDEPDLYEMIRREHLPKVERNVVKGAVIGRAYGLHRQVWGRNLGLTGKTTVKIDEVLSNLIDTSLVLGRVRGQHTRDGFIRNRYDRRVEVDDPRDHLLINAYAQSTGNDVALLGFASMLPRFQELEVDPLFVVHDSLVVSYPRKVREHVASIRTIKVPGYVQKFHLRFEPQG
jgi:hypothetical protein